jgi:hypothetical protein
MLDRLRLFGVKGKNGCVISQQQRDVNRPPDPVLD